MNANKLIPGCKSGLLMGSQHIIANGYYMYLYYTRDHSATVW